MLPFELIESIWHVKEKHRTQVEELSNRLNNEYIQNQDLNRKIYDLRTKVSDLEASLLAQRVNSA